METRLTYVSSIHFVSLSSAQNFCADAPCMNGGLCSEADGTFFCHCKPGFKGKNCEGKKKYTIK